MAVIRWTSAQVGRAPQRGLRRKEPLHAEPVAATRTACVRGPPACLRVYP